MHIHLPVFGKVRYILLLKQPFCHGKYSVITQVIANTDYTALPLTQRGYATGGIALVYMYVKA